MHRHSGIVGCSAQGQRCDAARAIHTWLPSHPRRLQARYIGRVQSMLRHSHLSRQKVPMKLLKMILPVLALAALGGCAVYPATGYDSYGYGGAPYVTEPPVTVYGSGSISYGNSYGYTVPVPVPVPVFPRGYYESRPPPPRPYYGGVFPRAPEAHRPPPSRPRPDAGQRPPNRGQYNRDRDGDGIPDRVDRDRDGDGVPNRYDRNPGNPRQRY